MKFTREKALALTGAALATALVLSCSGDGTTATDMCTGGICIGGGGDMSVVGGPCVENWVCSPWSTNGTNDQGTRTCTDTKSCGTTTLKPAETALLPALDKNFFKCNVQPVFDLKCSQLACHGTETGRGLRIYARGRLRNSETLAANAPVCNPANAAAVQLDTDCTSSVEGACRNCGHTTAEWQRNYDSARAFALDAQLQRIPAGQEDSSDLLAQPVVGGKVHSNIHLFRAKADADYVTIKQWLSGVTLATCTTLD